MVVRQISDFLITIRLEETGGTVVAERNQLAFVVVVEAFMSDDLFIYP